MLYEVYGFDSLVVVTKQSKRFLLLQSLKLKLALREVSEKHVHQEMGNLKLSKNQKSSRLS